MSSALLPALIGSQGGGGGGGGGDVTSVFGRQGVVAAQADDYTAGQITNVPAGTVAATNVQAAITEIDGEKASKATTVTAGAGLTGGGDLSAAALAATIRRAAARLSPRSRPNTRGE